MAVFVFSHVGHDIVEKNPFHVILQSVWGVSFKSDRLFEDFPGQAFGPGFSLSMPSLGNIVICQATVIEMIYTFTVYLLWFYVVF